MFAQIVPQMNVLRQGTYP